jgi:hydroxymethylglutaryl-CoA synthase
MGFKPEQIQNPLLDNVGDTGTALSLMILVSALEEASPGDRILVVSYGNGSDAILLRVTEEIKNLKSRRGIREHLKIKKVLDSYGRYLRWREMVDLAPVLRPEPTPPSMPAQWRERQTALPLYGVKCKKCGTPQMFLSPSSTRAHICLNCREKDNFEPYRFADKLGTVRSFSHDYLAGGIDPPNTASVIDFDGGGRGQFLMVDREPDECQVGMRVEMTFRKMVHTKHAHTYFWKCKPVR